jgi:predicted component of type VI protein secretion system
MMKKLAVRNGTSSIVEDGEKLEQNWAKAFQNMQARMDKELKKQVNQIIKKAEIPLDYKSRDAFKAVLMRTQVHTW